MPKACLGFNPQGEASLPSSISPITPISETQLVKEHVGLVFIGHVDHGKSTLCGRILSDLGLVSERTAENCIERWRYAGYLDDEPREEETGKTIEYARARFETNTKRYTILDAPGHRNYIPMMIDAAAQADVAILVISARSKEFEAGFQKSGQTREHIILAKTLGVRSIVVVVNKMDDSTVAWSKERFDTICKAVSSFLTAVGFSDFRFVPLSGFNGINVHGDVKEPLWYRGKSLLSTLDSLPPIPRNVDAPLVLPIYMVENEHGKVYVSGKIEVGTLSVDRDFVVMPGDHKVHVAAIYPDYGSPKTVSVGTAGENVRLELEKVPIDHLRRGAVMCLPNERLTTCKQFSTELKVLYLPPPVMVFSVGYKAMIHIHSEVVECEVKVLLSEFDKKGKKVRNKPPFVKAGSKVEAVIEVARPVVMEPYQKTMQLGRFTLRVGGDTIGFGIVLKCKPL